MQMTNEQIGELNTALAKLDWAKFIAMLQMFLSLFASKAKMGAAAFNWNKVIAFIVKFLPDFLDLFADDAGPAVNMPDA